MVGGRILDDLDTERAVWSSTYRGELRGHRAWRAWPGVIGGADSNNLAGGAASGHPLSPPSEGGEKDGPGDGPAPVGSRNGLGSVSAVSVSAGSLKPIGDGIRSASPFGLPKREGQHQRTSRQAPKESRVVRLIHPKGEAVPVPIGVGAGGIIRFFARSV